MKHMREAAVAGVLRTPFVKPESSFRGVPEADLIRLVIGELLFSYSIEPSSIDTVFVASFRPVREEVLCELRSACRSLGFDSHFRLITMCSGGISDLVALTAAVTRVSTGDSDVSLVVGVGIGEGDGVRSFNRGGPGQNHFPCRMVIDRYPSTYRDRLSFRAESDRKARDSSTGSRGTGLMPLSMPPYFDRIIQRDDLTDYEVENAPWDTGTGPEELPAELFLDFTAPQREGAGAIALTSMESSVGCVSGSRLRITGFRHLGIPPHLGGLGAAVALESLLSEKRVSLDEIDVFEILELTTAQTISSLEHLRSLLPRDEAFCVGNGEDGGVLTVNPFGGSLVYGFVPSCSGILMIASLMEYCNHTKSQVGAVLCEDPSGEAVALTVEKV